MSDEKVRPRYWVFWTGAFSHLIGGRTVRLHYRIKGMTLERWRWADVGADRDENDEAEARAKDIMDRFPRTIDKLAE